MKEIKKLKKKGKRERELLRFKNYILKTFINSQTLSYIIKYILNLAYTSIFGIERTLIKL